MTRSRRTSIPVPVDDRLPGLAAILDPARMAEAAATGLFPAGIRIEDCSPLYVRYKPGTNCLAAYALRVEGPDGPEVVHLHAKCHTPEEGPVQQAKAEEADWLEPGIAAPYAVVPEHDAVLLAFPNDPVLAGLRLAARPKKLQRVLYAHLEAFPESHWRISDRRLRVEPVRLKPEKRAVLRVDTKAVHREDGRRRPLRLWVRVQADSRGAETARFMEQVHDTFAGVPGLATPRPVVHLPDHGLTIVEDAGGEPLGMDEAGLAAAGDALAALHASALTGLTAPGLDGVLGAAADTRASIGALSTELGDLAGELFDRLVARGRSLDDRTDVPVHGDAHPGQFLRTGDGVVLLDFDRAHAGDPAEDVGNMAAHLIETLGVDAGGFAGAAGEILSTALPDGRGAGKERLTFWTGLGLLMRAPSPFRRLAADWPVAIRRILEAGLEATS